MPTSPLRRYRETAGMMALSQGWAQEHSRIRGCMSLTAGTFLECIGIIFIKTITFQQPSVKMFIVWMAVVLEKLEEIYYFLLDSFYSWSKFSTMNIYYFRIYEILL